MRSLALLLVLTLPATALAQDSVLPKDLSWCQPLVEVLDVFDEPNELSDDMFDAVGRFAGVDGFYRMVFENNGLSTLEFRFFESPDDVQRVSRSLDKQLGEGADTGRALVWKRAGGVQVSFKGQSEQMKVTWEVPPERCSAGGMSLDRTAQEEADLEAMRKKKAIDYDPYEMTDDPDSQIVVNKKKEEAKEEKKKQKKKDAGVKDTDIDW